MKYWLVMFILTDGAWVPGVEIPNAGWGPRAYDSLEVCQTRRDFAANLVKQIGKSQTKHFCTKNPKATLAQLEQANEK